MIGKIKNFFFLLTLLLIFPTASLAVEVPSGPCANSKNLPECVSTLFTWGIGFGTTIAIISFAIGAVTFIISIESAEMKNDAKDRMRHAVLGVILLGASFLILQTINKNLVEQTLIPLSWENIPETGPADGVYFYINDNCSDGSFSGLLKTGIDSMPSTWKSFKILNNEEENLVKYGVVLHKTPGLTKGGECSNFITDTDCQSIGKINGAVDVVQIYQEPDETGNGVIFYSAPWGENRGARAGVYSVEPNDITPPSILKNATEMKFSWNGIQAVGGYKNMCPNFQKCPGSIDVKGDYFIIAYSNITSGIQTNNKYCQTFVANVPNFNIEPIVASATGEPITTPLPTQAENINSSTNQSLSDILNQLNNIRNSTNPADFQKLASDLKSFDFNQDLIDNLINGNQDPLKITELINAVNNKKNSLLGKSSGIIENIIIVPTLGRAR